MMRSVQSPARKPGTRSTGRPSPGGTPRPRNTGSRSRAENSRIASGSHNLTACDGRLSTRRSTWLALAALTYSLDRQYVKLIQMGRRVYRLGRRQTSVDLTTSSILAAARELVAQGPASQASVGAVARRAGVSRITVYNRFGSRAGLLQALAPPHERPDLGES